MEKKKLLAGLFGVCILFVFSMLPLGTAHAQATKEPIKIGMDMELTGTMSATTINVKRGYDLYLDEIGWKVAGRDIKLIEVDNKTNPKISLEVAQKLVEKEKVHILGFGTNSPGAIAVRGYAETAKVPMVVVALAGAERVTLPPNKYIFRVSYADGQSEPILGPYAYEKMGLRRMALLGPDYSGSTGKLWAFQQGFEKAGGKIVQTILWSLEGEVDLAPHLSKIKSDVQGVFMFTPGDMFVNRFLSQYFEMGLDKKYKLVTTWMPASDYLAVKNFGEKMLGVVSSDIYVPSYDTPMNRRITERYRAKYGTSDRDMNMDAAFGYEGMQFIVAALTEIKGNIENTEAFLKAMHKTKIKGIHDGLISMDENGNVIRDWYIQEVQKKGGVVQNVMIQVVPQVRQPAQGFTIMPGK